MDHYFKVRTSLLHPLNSSLLSFTIIKPLYHILFYTKRQQPNTSTNKTHLQHNVNCWTLWFPEQKYQRKKCTWQWILLLLINRWTSTASPPEISRFPQRLSESWKTHFKAYSKNQTCVYPLKHFSLCWSPLHTHQCNASLILNTAISTVYWNSAITEGGNELGLRFPTESRKTLTQMFEVAA